MPSMHRTVEIAWTPNSDKGWATFSTARREAARLWNDLVVRHARLRRLHWKWPSKARWETWAKGRYPLLHSQTVQHLIDEFLEAVRSTQALRKNGHSEARFPWRQLRFRDLPFSNQGARIRGKYLLLPCGNAGTLAIRLPQDRPLPGRLMEVRLAFGTVRLVCLAEPVQPPGPEAPVVGVDLGVNTLAAATDGDKALVVSGRGAKAIVQYRNKKLASLQQAQATTQRGSRTYRRLQRRKYKLLDKTHRKVRDLCHKTSRLLVDAFPGAWFVVGQPFNEAAQKVRRVQAQQVSQACTRKLIQMMKYKAGGAVIEVPEPYSSQTCPVCGCRQKCRRTYQCKDCGFRAPRDVVGALNIRQIGGSGGMRPIPGLKVPQVEFRHASKYPGRSQVVPAEPRHVAQGPQGS